MGDAVWDERAPGKKPPKRPTPAPTPVPLPVGTSQPIRVTSELDGEILNRGYSYFSQCWDRGEDVWFAFVGHADGHPRFFQIEGTAITRLGSLVPYGGTGEGWAWTQAGDVMLCDGPRLRRVNPFTGSDVVVLDISSMHPGCDLWQSHSSDDGQTHSATVRQIVDSGSYPKIGTVVQCLSGRLFFQAIGTLDESHVTGDGLWLIIEESNNNRIIDLLNGSERHITNAEGALAHIDCGADFAVGEDEIRGACTYLKLQTLERRELFHTWSMGHVSVKAGRCLLSNATSISLVDLDTGVVSPLIAHGMAGPADYDHQVHGSLDPSGQVAAWVSNQAGRFDLYVCRVP